jgi:general L-amino acid transport system substrate-binding protein
MMRVSLLALCLACAACAPALAAQSRLSEIKSRGHLACAAFPRPGLARESDGKASSGLFGDLCRAIAIAALGPEAKYEFTALELPKDSDELKHGAFDVLFLTEGEIAGAAVADTLAPGPAAFYETYRLLVPRDSAIAKPEDLAGKSLCFHELTDEAVAALDQRFDRAKLSFGHAGFQEDVEMLDSYNVHYCDAVASESTDLARIGLQRGVLKFESRLLPEPLGVLPILTMTPLDDPRWSAAASWVVQFVIAAERPQSRWSNGAAKAMSLDGASLGLAGGWRENILEKVGDYGAIYRRNLGEGSPLKLSRGVNALWSDGGLFAPPVPEGGVPPH